MRASSSLAERVGAAARAPPGRARLLARALDLGAQPQLQLAGGLLGERHRDDAIELGAPARDHRDDPADQRGGLAGAGRGLDHQRGIEVVADAIAHRADRQSRGAPIGVDGPTWARSSQLPQLSAACASA